MTKKDYILISNILKEYRQSMRARDYNDLVDDFARHLAFENPRFDVYRFREACNYNPSKLLKV
jgi:hypothetical protein